MGLRIFYFLWLLVASAFWWWLSLERTGLAQIKATGTLRVGYALEAPYAFLGPDGEVTGESPEIARVVARRLGIRRLVWRASEFANLISELQEGEFDLIAAGLFITPERQQQVAFSRPTFRVLPGLLVPESSRLEQMPDSPLQYPSPIAVLAGSAEEEECKQAGVAAPQVLSLPDAYSAFQAVHAGRAASLALSPPSLTWMARREPGFRVLRKQQSRAALGAFAFRKNDSKLVQAWDEQLRHYIGTPEHQRLVESFGFTRSELP